MSEVVDHPRKRHKCQVGWELRPLSDDHPCRKDGFTSYYASVGDFDPPGTIRRCECGKTWVGYRERYMPGMTGQLSMTTHWRPEGRFERWRRERRQRSALPTVTNGDPTTGICRDETTEDRR